MKYECTASFLSHTGQRYIVGDQIGDYEYTHLHYEERKNFLEARQQTTPEPRDERDPSWYYPASDSQPTSNVDEDYHHPTFGGGSFGGAGAGSNFDSPADDRPDVPDTPDSDTGSDSDSSSSGD